MANDKLRQALRDAGLGSDDLAEIVQVDVRTVRRWLSGGTPYARQRGKVARALEVTEHDLWPEIVATRQPGSQAAQPSDLRAGYTAASDLAAPDWKAMMREATDRIELLGDTLSPILSTPGARELLAAKASHGCQVRILVSHPVRHLVPLLDKSGIDVRVLDLPARYTIYRFDEQLLLTLHLTGEDTDRSPLLYLRRAAPEGLFDRFADHYSELWEENSQPIDPDLPLDDEDDDERPEPQQPVVETANLSAPAPRRWPRRP